MFNGIVNHCAALQFQPPDYCDERITVDDNAYLKWGLIALVNSSVYYSNDFTYV